MENKDIELNLIMSNNKDYQDVITNRNKKI